MASKRREPQAKGGAFPKGRRIRPISEPRANPTALLLAWNRGEPDALDALLPLVYEELRRLAARYIERVTLIS